MVDRYLIWSFYHGEWWGANRSGYVRTARTAGRYSAQDAIEILCDDVTRRNMPVRDADAADDKWPAKDVDGTA